MSLPTWEVRCGDALTLLRETPAESVRCVVTSPPYWGLRDYGTAGQLGLERTPGEYVAAMVAVFGEVRRVLAKDGTLWLNLGDSYNAYRANVTQGGPLSGRNQHARAYFEPGRGLDDTTLKPKDLVGIPWRMAFALQADGWWLRSDIIWAKPNPMPESVTDRPTKAHEYLFLLAKSARYYYDAAAVREDNIDPKRTNYRPGKEAYTEGNVHDDSGRARRNDGFQAYADGKVCVGRNARTVWTIATQPFAEAHFATFPTALVEPCVKAGSAPGDTVLDPFAGSGTVGVVALRLGRSFVGLEMNPTYCEMARHRITDDAPLLNAQAEP